MERIEQVITMSFNHIYGSWSFFNIKKKKKKRKCTVIGTGTSPSLLLQVMKIFLHCTKGK